MLYRVGGQYKTSYHQDQAIFPLAQDRWIVTAFVLAGFLVIPFVATPYVYTEVLIPVLILSIAAIGLNILTGYCGQVSLGTGGFMAVAAYASYNFWLRAPLFNDLIVVILVGGLTAAMFGILFGVPSLRIKGFYLAVATLAAQFFVDWGTARIKWLTNYAPSGSVSVANLKALGIPIDTPMTRYLFIFSLTIILAIVAKNFVRGRIGRQWMAIRDMDIAAEIMGVRPASAKLTAFAVSSFYIGVAGALFAFLRLGAWEPQAFGIERSFQVLFMIIIGGLGSILGSFLGAIFIVLLPIFLNQLPGWIGIQLSTATIAHVEFMVFGAIILLVLIFEPHGLARIWQIIKDKLRLWPFPY